MLGGEMCFSVRLPLATLFACVGLSPLSTRDPLPFPTDNVTPEKRDDAHSNPIMVPLWMLLPPLTPSTPYEA